ncbi:hypothetical protein [Caulobacter zeae]|nr:hypothetical protein [Caulobacter zeae]
MTKIEAERAIRSLCHSWRKEAGLLQADQTRLSFFGFWAWMSSNHPGYLKFRSTTSVMGNVQRWFESEFGQTAWRGQRWACCASKGSPRPVRPRPVAVYPSRVALMACVFTQAR